MSCNTDTNLCISQYASYEMVIQLSDGSGSYLDISTWSFSGSIKDTYKSTTPVVNFGVSILSYPSASVSLYLTPAQTALLTKSQYYYDLIAEVSGSSPQTTYRLLEGTVSMDPGVTRGSLS